MTYNMLMGTLSPTHSPTHVLIVCCLDDEHSDREPEHTGHVCVSVHAADCRCRGGRNSFVTRQHPRSVHLSRLADKSTAVEFPVYVHVRDSADGTRTLHCRRLSNLVQL